MLVECCLGFKLSLVCLLVHLEHKGAPNTFPRAADDVAVIAKVASLTTTGISHQRAQLTYIAGSRFK